MSEHRVATRKCATTVPCSPECPAGRGLSSRRIGFPRPENDVQRACPPVGERAVTPGRKRPGCGVVPSGDFSCPGVDLSCRPIAVHSTSHIAHNQRSHGKPSPIRSAGAAKRAPPSAISAAASSGGRAPDTKRIISVICWSFKSRRPHITTQPLSVPFDLGLSHLFRQPRRGCTLQCARVHLVGPVRLVASSPPHEPPPP